MLINGLSYQENLDFTVNYNDKIIIWNLTEQNGGFDLTPNDEVVVVYDHYIVEE